MTPAREASASGVRGGKNSMLKIGLVLAAGIGSFLILRGTPPDVGRVSNGVVGLYPPLGSTIIVDPKESMDEILSSDSDPA